MWSAIPGKAVGQTHIFTCTLLVCAVTRSTLDRSRHRAVMNPLCNTKRTKPSAEGPALDKPFSAFRLVCYSNRDEMHGYKCLHRTVGKHCSCKIWFTCGTENKYRHLGNLLSSIPLCWVFLHSCCCCKYSSEPWQAALQPFDLWIYHCHEALPSENILLYL